METIINKSKVGYSFKIKEANKDIFSSEKDFFLIPDVKSHYKYAWEAYSCSRKLIKLYPISLNNIKMNKLQKLTQGEFNNKQALLDAELILEQQHQAKRLDLILGTGNKIQEMTKAFQADTNRRRVDAVRDVAAIVAAGLFALLNVQLQTVLNRGL